MKQYCTYCGEGHDINKDLVAHRKVCLKNPNSQSNKEKEKAKKLKPYTDLQKAVTSYDDIFDRLDAFLLEKGFVIEWNQKPDQWYDNIKNTDVHISPTLVTSTSGVYSGWRGQFNGVIKPIVFLT